jgi:hypothetical protein
MNERTMLEGRADRDALRRQLAAQRLRPEVIENMIRAAEAAGAFAAEQPHDVPPSIAEDTESQAVTIALATFDSRLEVGDLVARAEPQSVLGRLYRAQYMSAIDEACLDRVEFIDRFPVLTGHYGYTRGDPSPGARRSSYASRPRGLRLG